MTREHTYALIASSLIVLIALILSFWPISQARLISAGVDSYSNHIPLFGNRTLTQTINSPHPITGLGVILVNMRRAKQIPDVEIELYSPQEQKTILTTSIPAGSITDDTFARIRFTEPLIAKGTMEIRLRSSQATIENPIGVRIDPETIIAPHVRRENGQTKPGSLAIEVLEKVPGWQAVITAANRHQDTWLKTAGALLVTIVAIICGMLLPLPSWKPKTVTIYKVSVLIALALCALISRIIFLSHFSGVSGGDPYNYLLIAKSMAHGESPFNEGEKRLPGYPALLIPAVLNNQTDDHLVMRVISSVSAAGSLLVLALLAKNLALPWPVQFIAPLLIAWQKDFLATSMRPEPYTFYTFLLLTVLALFTLPKPKPWQEIVMGIVLGWAAMTRQEGFVLSVLIAVAWIIFRITARPFVLKQILLSFLRTFLPALLIVLPFFIHNTTTYGNPFFTPYFEGDRLQIVDSWPAFKDNLGGTWGVLGSSWRVTWDELERYSFSNPFILIGSISTVIVCGIFTFVPAHKKPVVAGITMVISVAFLLIFTLLSLTGKTTLTSIFPPFLAGIIFTAWVPFLWHTKYKGLVVVCIAVSQILIATWFHPFAKHYQQVFPLISLTIAAAFFTHTRANNHPLSLKVAATKTGAALIILPIGWLSIWTYQDINAMIDKQNANAALDSVAYRAVKFALQQPGPHGFDQAYLPARLYFGNDGIYFYDEVSDVTREATWLQESNIHILVTTNDGQTFATPHSNWEKLASFKSEGKDEQLYESVVYRIHNP